MVDLVDVPVCGVGEHALVAFVSEGQGQGLGVPVEVCSVCGQLRLVLGSGGVEVSVSDRVAMS